MISIAFASIFVDDQSRALAFYPSVVGFEVKVDMPLGEGPDAPRWITVVSPRDPDGVQLLLEPNGHPVAVAFHNGLREHGIPATAFLVDDLAAEYDRMTALGVEFTGPPTTGGGVSNAVFDDTCGNLIGLTQV
jgi:predicted enzyme related to lactoylglutathione lyase